MATYYVSTTGNDSNTGGSADPFLTVNKAVTVSGSGDVINVAAGTYIETATLSPSAAISIVGATGVASDVVVKENGVRPIMDLGDPLTISDITLDQDSGGTSNDGCIDANWQAVLATNCTFKTTLSGIYQAGTGSLIKRCRFIQQKNAAGNWLSDTECIGLYAFGLTTTESCLFQDFTRYGAYISSNAAHVHPTIRNCTSVRLEQAPRDFSAGYAAGPIYVYNCVFLVGNSPLTGSGTPKDPSYALGANNFGGAGYPFAEECVGYGTGSDADDFEHSANYQAFNNCFSQTQVAANGNPILVDAVNQDYHPDTTGVAYHAGDAAHAPTKDLDDNDFDSPPSIGCLEAPAAPAGGGGGAVMNSRAGLLPSPFTLTP